MESSIHKNIPRVSPPPFKTLWQHNRPFKISSHIILLTPDVKEPFQSPSFKKSSATDSPQLFDLETTQPATYCIWEYYKRSSEDSLHKNLTVLRGNPSQDENSRFTLSLMQLMKALTAALRNSEEAMTLCSVISRTLKSFETSQSFLAAPNLFLLKQTRLKTLASPPLSTSSS